MGINSRGQIRVTLVQLEDDSIVELMSRKYRWLKFSKVVRRVLIKLVSGFLTIIEIIGLNAPQTQLNIAMGIRNSFDVYQAKTIITTVGQQYP